MATIEIISTIAQKRIIKNKKELIVVSLLLVYCVSCILCQYIVFIPVSLL